MRVSTFNINGIKARLPRLLEWLAETRPAVACLQEIKTQDEGFPADEFHKLGYHALWHGQKGFNGVAILARQPLLEPLAGIPGYEDDQRRVRCLVTHKGEFDGERWPVGGGNCDEFRHASSVLQSLRMGCMPVRWERACWPRQARVLRDFSMSRNLKR